MIRHIKDYTVLVLKGFAMGAANVIPGVSGGTIALVTGIFEKLIHSIKSIDHKAFGYLLRGKLGSFSSRINLPFLVAVFFGALLSVFTLARVLSFLFENYPVYIWSYFFGLILASVFFVGSTIEKWSISIISALITGLIIAVGISYLSPAEGDESLLYLVLCGAIAVSSMILPGLSGSFILILMGNYELIAIEAINDFRLDILIPVGIGIVLGLILFSHFLSWIFKKFRYQTIASLTGFIMGSLLILWPWKDPVYRTDGTGSKLLTPDGSAIIENYEIYLPQLSPEVALAFVIITAGFLSIWVIEKIAETEKT